MDFKGILSDNHIELENNWDLLKSKHFDKEIYIKFSRNVAKRNLLNLTKNYIFI